MTKGINFPKTPNNIIVENARWHRTQPLPASADLIIGKWSHELQNILTDKGVQFETREGETAIVFSNMGVSKTEKSVVLKPSEYEKLRQIYELPELPKGQAQGFER